MNINSIQNGPKQVSNRIAKTGAAVGLTASIAYLAKNYDDIFAKSIRNAESITVEQITQANPDLVKQIEPEVILSKIVKNTKIAAVAIPLVATAAVVGGVALFGKVVGTIVDKINLKKAEKNENIDKTSTANSNVSFKGTVAESGQTIPLFLDKADHEIEYSNFNKLGNDVYASRRNCQKAVNPFVINATETRYIDGMPEEINFPLFVSDGDCEMAFINYDKLNEYKEVYGKAFDKHCESNAEVAD